jgi:DNA-binding transcriptional ArsR family regulator
MRKGESSSDRRWSRRVRASIQRAAVDATCPAAYFGIHLINGATTINRVYRALADPTRRRVLALLRERDMTAGELAAQFELSWPTMSGHFNVLREADLIAADKVGTTITYHINLSVLEEAMASLLDVFKIQPRGTP